tara:strand:- start:241 stop:1335 length:1095 start_codon:yes stop_codon:yes gene_type:complete
MSNKSVTVLGSGNTGFSVAANLTLQGHSVALYELPEFDSSLKAIEKKRTIKLEGVAKQGNATIDLITSDIQKALDFSDLVLLTVPAYAHKRFAEVCAPHLKKGHTVTLIPGTLGSLEWSRVLREAGCTDVTLAEVDTAPYVCRRTAPDTATILGIITGLGFGVLPSIKTPQVVEMLEPLFPGMTPYKDAMACGLSSMNPVVHPAGVLMNAGRIEYSRGEFYFYAEGVSSSVAKVIMQVDDERRSIGTTLGYNLIPVNEGFHQAGFGPKGDLWSTINGSLMLSKLKAPGTLDNRWMSEDIPYGIVTWSQIGEQYNVPTPIMKAFVDVGSVVMGSDAWSTGRTLHDLGISGISKTKLGIFLETGKI